MLLLALCEGGSEALRELVGVRGGETLELGVKEPLGVGGGVPLREAVRDPVAVVLGVKEVDRVRESVALEDGVGVAVPVREVLGVTSDVSGGSATPRRMCPRGAAYTSAAASEDASMRNTAALVHA